MIPRRHKPHQDLAIAGLPGWFILQLYFNAIQDLGPLVGCEPSEIFGHTLRILNFVHDVFETLILSRKLSPARRLLAGKSQQFWRRVSVDRL